VDDVDTTSTVDVDVDVDVDATDDGTGVVSPDEKRNNVDNDNANDNIHDNDGTHQEQDHLLGKALLQEPFDASFLSPRMGKFSLQVHERGVVATKKNDPTVQLTIFRDSTSSASSTTNTTNSSCSHVLVFPKPEDCKAIVYNRKIDALQSRPKKVNGSLVLLQFESPLQLEPRLSKKPSLQLCFALPFDAKTKGPVGPSLVVAEGEETQVDTEIETADNNNNDNNDNNDPTEAWGKLLHRALGGKLVQVLKGSSSSLPSSGGEPTASTRTCRNAGCGDGDDVNFESYQPPNTSTTTAGMPFVGCYLGVNDGVLYPLREGLLFYKPPRFLPRTSLHSIACGRGGSGGDSSSRYVDMVIQCSNSKNSSSNSNSSNNDDNDDDNDNDNEPMETVEFTNIQREETGVLNAYIHNVLIPAMTKDAHVNSNANKRNDDDDSDSDSDSDEVVVEAIAEDDDDNATEDDNLVEEVLRGEESAASDSDSDDEDFEAGNGNGDNSDDDDEEDVNGNNNDDDDEGIAVVADEFAQELVREKRRKQQEDESSATESEDDQDGRSSSGGRPRASKRLRRR